MKLLTVVVPCYNSAAYMQHAIDSLLTGGEEMDILLVDDGSTDETGAIADRNAAAHPGVIRVIHQPNGGHGEGLNRGIETAQGIYFKVLDSDDRLDPEGLRALLDLLRAHTAPEDQADLVVHDYVYDRPEKPGVFSITYRRIMPTGRIFGWGDCRRFGAANQFMIHSIVYRVALLREHGYRLPAHTFYEDNLYIYQPLPWTKKLLYLDRVVYGYNIGREDQSINEKNILRRVDQLTNMITKMATSWTLADLERQPKQLRDYMITNAVGQIWSLSALHFIADTPESLAMNRKMWQDIRDFDEGIYQRLWRHPVGITTHLPGRLGRSILVFAYRTGRRFMHF